MKTISLGLFALVLLAQTLPTLAQDARLSQPWSNPAMMNPALSGNFDGINKLGMGSSWMKNGNNKVAHQYLYIDNRIDLPEYSPNKFIGLNVNLYQYGNDLTGVYPNTSPINASFLSVSGAYHFNLSADEKHSMGIGIQGVMARGDLLESRGVYDKEIAGGGFIYTNLVPNGSAKVQKRDYFDLNTGAYYRFRGQDVKAEIGAGLYHFLNPNVGIKSPSGGLHSRAVVHALIDMKLTHNLNLRFRQIAWEEGLFWRSNKIEKTAMNASWTGMELCNPDPDGRCNLSGGLYTRSFRTIMPYFSMHVTRGVNLRASYEMPLSPAQYGSYTAHRFELGIQLMRFDPNWEY